MGALRFLRVLRPDWLDWFKKPEPHVFGVGAQIQLKGKPHIHGKVLSANDPPRFYTVQPWNRERIEFWTMDEVEYWVSICSTEWKYLHHLHTRNFTYWFPLSFTLQMFQLVVLWSAMLIVAAQYRQMKFEIEAEHLRWVVCETLGGR